MVVLRNCFCFALFCFGFIAWSKSKSRTFHSIFRRTNDNSMCQTHAFYFTNTHRNTYTNARTHVATLPCLSFFIGVNHTHIYNYIHHICHWWILHLYAVRFCGEWQIASNFQNIQIILLLRRYSGCSILFIKYIFV